MSLNNLLSTAKGIQTKAPDIGSQPVKVLQQVHLQMDFLGFYLLLKK